MCYTRAVFCRRRGCYNTVGELILEPCEHATTSGCATADFTTPVQRFRALDDAPSDSGCRSGEGESEGWEAGEDEWFAVSRAYLFGCGHRDFVQRHRCGYRSCAECFQQDMMASILELVENGTGGSGKAARSLLARRQDLSLTRQAEVPTCTLASPSEECRMLFDTGIQDPEWPGYPTMFDDDDALKAKDPEFDMHSIALDYQEGAGFANDIYDGSFNDDGQFEDTKSQVHQEIFYASQDESYHYQDQEPSLQPVSLADATMLAIDPQLLDWQGAQGQLLDMLIQPGDVLPKAEAAATPGSRDPGSSCVGDVGDTASVGVLGGLDADVEAMEGDHGQEFTHLLEESLPCGDAGSRVWNQDVVWDASRYYS